MTFERCDRCGKESSGHNRRDPEWYDVAFVSTGNVIPLSRAHTVSVCPACFKYMTEGFKFPQNLPQNPPQPK
jgi:hypothetical protein